MQICDHELTKLFYTHIYLKTSQNTYYAEWEWGRTKKSVCVIISFYSLAMNVKKKIYYM